jgi:hypothetical protein
MLVKVRLPKKREIVGTLGVIIVCLALISHMHQFLTSRIVISRSNCTLEVDVL